MEPNTTPAAPPMSQEPQAPVVTPVIVPPKVSQTSYGALIGLIVVVAAIAGGAYYLFTDRVNELIEITESQQAAIAAFDAQSRSTEPEAIEADLAAKSPDEFDAEMERAFAALEEAFSESETQ